MPSLCAGGRPPVHARVAMRLTTSNSMRRMDMSRLKYVLLTVAAAVSLAGWAEDPPDLPAGFTLSDTLRFVNEIDSSECQLLRFEGGSLGNVATVMRAGDNLVLEQCEIHGPWRSEDGNRVGPKILPICLRDSRCPIPCVRSTRRCRSVRTPTSSPSSCDFPPPIRPDREGLNPHNRRKCSTCRFTCHCNSAYKFGRGNELWRRRPIP